MTDEIKLLDEVKFKDPDIYTVYSIYIDKDNYLNSDVTLLSKNKYPIVTKLYNLEKVAK